MSRRGFSLLELIIATSIVLAAVALAARSLKTFPLMSWMADDAEIERQTDGALNRMVKDLQESIPGSVVIDSTRSATLGFAKPAATADGPVLPVVYAYSTDAPDGGALYRIENGSPTIFISNIRRPADVEPLFNLESRLNIVTISLRRPASGRSSRRYVRRVSL
jgi:prepilin-type N-terminal cleavage/methylation domain-containing protein